MSDSSIQVCGSDRYRDWHGRLTSVTMLLVSQEDAKSWLADLESYIAALRSDIIKIRKLVLEYETKVETDRDDFTRGLHVGMAASSDVEAERLEHNVFVLQRYQQKLTPLLRQS